MEFSFGFHELLCQPFDLSFRFSDIAVTLRKRNDDVINCFAGVLKLPGKYLFLHSED